VSTLEGGFSDYLRLYFNLTKTHILGITNFNLTMEPIAIIGFAFKLPQGADDSELLWKILEEGRNVMSEWPPSRINIESFYNPDVRKRNAVRPTHIRTFRKFEVNDC
jgi:hypothetical protein